MNPYYFRTAQQVDDNESASDTDEEDIQEAEPESVSSDDSECDVEPTKEQIEFVHKTSKKKLHNKGNIIMINGQLYYMLPVMKTKKTQQIKSKQAAKQSKSKQEAKQTPKPKQSQPLEKPTPPVETKAQSKSKQASPTKGKTAIIESNIDEADEADEGDEVDKNELPDNLDTDKIDESLKNNPPPPTKGETSREVMKEYADNIMQGKPHMVDFKKRINEATQRAKEKRKEVIRQFYCKHCKCRTWQDSLSTYKTTKNGGMREQGTCTECNTINVHAAPKTTSETKK